MPDIAMKLVPIILSGGAGTRLWPLSREAAPKPFMALPDGDTLLGKTFARATALKNVAGLLTITNRDYYFRTKDALAGAITEAPDRVTYLLEPFGRNTGPAIALGALYAEAAYGSDATLLVMPADHLVRDQASFAAAVEEAAPLAAAGWIVTFGIGPTHPETGYGYIECGAKLDDANAFRVIRFIEKPPLADAEGYVADGDHVWNSGIFCFTPATILSALQQYAPTMLTAARAVWQALRAAHETDQSMLEIDSALFAAVPDISIDYAVMEKAAKVAVVRARFDWSDIGSWQAISELSERDASGNSGQGTRVAIDTHDTFILADERVVATVGVESLVIIDTPDALLVAHRDHLQRVREVVGELKARGHDSYKLHRTVARPWGAYTVLQEGPGFKIKRIEVKPGAALSLQLHHKRSEHWVVVSGEALVTNGERSYSLVANESTYIPLETQHRLANPASEPLVMIEVQCGDYLGEDDIVRFDDQYGRVGAKA